MFSGTARGGEYRYCVDCPMVEPDAAQPKAYAHTPEDETDHFTCVASFAKDEQGTLIDRVLS